MMTSLKIVKSEINAFIIGNGKSRENFDLDFLRGKGAIFGCNALYRDFKPDYLVAIDDAIINEIRSSDFPSEKFIEPPEHEKWEPADLHWSTAHNKKFIPVRPRSNAGMNAIMEAIKLGHDQLYILGFDFLINDKELSVTNMYDGTPCYGLETRANHMDNCGRLNYLAWLMCKYPYHTFTFCFPENTNVFKPTDIPNFKLMSYDDFKLN
jgi:hypothetical protein